MVRSKPEKRFWALASRLAAIGLLMALVACASTPARNPVPPQLTSQVGIEWIPEARFWGDEWPSSPWNDSKLGYQMARKRYPWVKAPPGFIRAD